MRSTNVEKEEVLMDQFITRSQIKILCDGGRWDKIQQIFNDARSIAESRGKRNYHDNKVHTELVLELLGINEAQIHKYAKIERQIKRDTSADQSSVSQIR